MRGCGHFTLFDSFSLGFALLHQPPDTINIGFSLAPFIVVIPIAVFRHNSHQRYGRNGAFIYYIIN